MVSIIEVTDKAQLRRFVDYPNELYKDGVVPCKCSRKSPKNLLN